MGSLINQSVFRNYVHDLGLWVSRDEAYRTNYWEYLDFTVDFRCRLGRKPGGYIIAVTSWTKRGQNTTWCFFLTCEVRESLQNDLGIVAKLEIDGEKLFMEFDLIWKIRKSVDQNDSQSKSSSGIVSLRWSMQLGQRASSSFSENGFL